MALPVELKRLGLFWETLVDFDADFCEGAAQVIGGKGFPQAEDRAVFHGGVTQLGVIRVRQGDNLGVCIVRIAFDPADYIRPVKPGHAQVHEQHIRPEQGHLLSRLKPVRRHGDLKGIP